MDITLEDTVALITGGSRGIGKAIGLAYLKLGAEVVLTSRREESLSGACEELKELSGSDKITYYPANAGDPHGPADVVSKVLERTGRIDTLVNNAGTNPHYGSLLAITPSQCDKIHEVNLRGPLLWTQEVWKRYWSTDEASRGSVINIASIAGLSVDRGIAYYGVSKAALIHLTKNLAPEMGPRVRVNAISPGLVKTDMARTLWETHEEAIANTFALRRLGEPHDIAQAAVFLASSLSQWMTGENIVVDGGALVS